MGRGGMSKGRTWAIVTIVTVALIVALGLGLGLGLGRKTDDDSKSERETATTTQQPPTTTRSPLYNPPSASREGKYRFAAVAADSEECSKIGNHVMAVQGGSAVDAAIAAILCVGVMNAHSCGIGGGHFLTYYKRQTGEVHTIIAREQAPSAATEDMFTEGKNASSESGGKAIGIPGEIRGLHEAWTIGGRLPWKQLFQPTIDLCKNGITVGPALIEGVTGKEKFYDEFPTFKEFITNPSTGDLYKEGDVMYRPRLARTLEIIADDPHSFYNGSLAENITQDIRDAGGIITQDDLANYTAPVKRPLVFKMHDNMTVYSPPPPSSGAVYQFILNILKGFRFDNTSVSTVDKALETWHRIVESFKHAYSLRTELGDSDIGSDAFKTFITQLVKNMTDPSFGESKRALINDTTTFGSAYYHPMFSSPWDHGTSHLSVLGPNGDAVSITSTINLHFGSKVIGRRTGIVFNDEMDDFSTPGKNNYFGVPPSAANFISPWKRPLSSMSPSIVVDGNGDVKLIVGASGGTRITTSTAQVTMETLWFNWGIKEAIDYPRIHHQLFPQEVRVQSGFPSVMIDGLRDMGHNVTIYESASAVVQGILRVGDQITANCDYRKHGEPDGY
ncbi:glutathione hydrolase 1 proenzyme-like [Mercenaria mercenaria]|uniref:glutathione hydrolase 1 proenzyme-like n=1 Tax=Mercenaria mercenaria TaxID=6596 RepID=UPI00234EA0F8|nr:glutathione hydrolase 1 proenzyme-like [Mercenaria mercenaria]